MIYLFDKEFRKRSALNILVNQCKYPGMYDECSCLGCKDIVDDSQGTCLACHEQSLFVDVHVKVFRPQPTPGENVNNNINDNQGTCLGNQGRIPFADDKDNVDKINSEDEVDIYLLREKTPVVKPCRRISL